MNHRSIINGCCLCLAASFFSSAPAPAAIVSEWDADDFAGGASWPGTATANVVEGAPVAGTDTTSIPGARRRLCHIPRYCRLGV